MSVVYTQNDFAAIEKFALDLHAAMCSRTRNQQDVLALYEGDFPALADQLAGRPFPAEQQVQERLKASARFEGSPLFWNFFKELTLKHVMNRAKDHLRNYHYKESLANYENIFSAVSNGEADNFAIPSVWINDICVEFLYQFQGFCQFRSRLTNKTESEIGALSKSNEWTYPDVSKCLNKLYVASGVKANGSKNVSESSSTLVRFGYFACIEYARLECIIGDHLSSIRIISSINISDRNDLFNSLPTCYVNVYYHLGISQMLLRRFSDAQDSFTAAILYINSILKPGAALNGDANLYITQALRLEQRSMGVLTVVKPEAVVGETMQRRLKTFHEKLLSTVAISQALCPGKRLDDQVRLDLQANARVKDKLHRLSEGDMKVFLELFESSCPKFIMHGKPDYTNKIDYNLEGFRHGVQIFMREVEQNISVLKLRSYLRLYAAIEVSKLARFNGVNSVTDFELELMSYKHKAVQVETNTIGVSRPVFASDINFYINDGNVEIFSANKKFEKEKRLDDQFIAGVRKQTGLARELAKKAAKVGI